MGFRQAIVLGSVSFFLGVLFICFNVDHKLLWGELTEETVQDGMQFYTTFYGAPPAIKALLHGLVGLGLVGLVSKLHNWDESAMFFDGSCLCIYMFGVAVYGTVIIPSLRTMVSIASEAEKIEAMRILSAANVIIGVCLCGVLLLQAGQEYARRIDVVAKQKQD